MVSDATEGGGERKPDGRRSAEESGGRYVTVRARTIETEATERQTNAKERKRREKHRQEEVGAFAGCGRTRRRAGEGNSRRRLERRRETVEAMRSLTAVGDGRREGPLVVQHAGSVSGRETSLRRSRLALSSSSAALAHAGKRAVSFTRLQRS